MNHQGTQVLFVPRWLKNKVDAEQRQVSCLDSIDDLLCILKPDDFAFYYSLQDYIRKHPTIRPLLRHNLDFPMIVQTNGIGMLSLSSSGAIPASMVDRVKKSNAEFELKRAELGEDAFQHWLLTQCLSGQQVTPVIGYDVFQIGACTVGISPKYMTEDLPIYIVENQLYEAFLDAIAPWTPIEAMASYEAFERFTLTLAQ